MIFSVNPKEIPDNINPNKIISSCLLFVTVAAPLGSKLVPFLIGVHVWTLNIHVCNHRSTSICALNGANRVQRLQVQVCTSEGCTDMRVHTTTLTGANLRWLHLYGCKLAFGVLDCALQGAGILTFFGVQTGNSISYSVIRINTTLYDGKLWNYWIYY